MASDGLHPTSRSEGSEYCTPITNNTSPTGSTPFSSSACEYQSSRIDAMKDSRSDYQSAVEFEIAASKAHWTVVDSDDEMEYSPEDDLKHFESLKLDYRWSVPHDEDPIDEHHLVVGEKIAQGGQAGIYAAKLNLPGQISERVVLKVFKEGSSLRALQQQWSPAMVKYWTNNKFGQTSSMGIVRGAVLFKAGILKNRFAFVMNRWWGDLRKHIDLQMLHRHNNRGPPYSSEWAMHLMFQIAGDMLGFDQSDMLHRDLKASNVLVQLPPTLQNMTVAKFRQFIHSMDDSKTGFWSIPELLVADFECSVGVVGTGFWRAPEILQQLKDGVRVRKVKFTSKADVYSYGMTCYEIVTGCIPFENESCQNYGIVLSGKQPILPHDLDPAIRNIIISCWQLDPLRRPSFRDLHWELGCLKGVFRRENTRSYNFRDY